MSCKPWALRAPRPHLSAAKAPPSKARRGDKAGALVCQRLSRPPTPTGCTRGTAQENVFTCDRRELVAQPGVQRVSRTFACAAVLEGLDVVYKVEKVGSPSGAPAKKVVITNSGELPATDTA